MSTTKTLELTVPRRIECRADVDDTVGEFYTQLNRYLATHGVDVWEKHFNQPNTHYEILPYATARLIHERDIDELVKLLTDQRSVPYYGGPPREEARIRDSIPWRALDNAYGERLKDIEHYLEQIAKLNARIVELAPPEETQL